MNAIVESDQSVPVTATPVEESRRVTCLPAHFGSHMLVVEANIFRWCSRLCPEYSGGAWHFFELSNGGFYMAPDMSAIKVPVVVGTNDYSGSLSPDALGIVACLFAFSHLSFHLESECIGEHFHLLRDYVAGHAEAPEIFRAID